MRNRPLKRLSMGHRSDTVINSSIHVSSLDAQSCYVDEFGVDATVPRPLDITRVYRFMHRGTADETIDEFFDIAATVHRSPSGLHRQSRGTEHQCTDMCRPVVPVVPVGWEKFLPNIYRWWNWDGNRKFFNDGIVFVQDAHEVQKSLVDTSADLEVITTYEQLLAIFPVRESGDQMFLP